MTANAHPSGSGASRDHLARIGRRSALLPREPHRTRTTRVVQIVGLAAAIGCNAAVAQSPRAASGQDQQSSAIIEIACPRGSQILVLLQSSTAPAFVAVDEMPAAGQGDAKRLDAATVPPETMPNTLELTQTVGDKDVFVSIRDQAPNANSPKDSQSHLEGYIGCGEWQARVLGGQPNAFLLKRTPPAQSAPEPAPAPQSLPREANAAPPPMPNTPPAPPAPPVNNDQRANRGGGPSFGSVEPNVAPPPATNPPLSPPARNNDQRASRGGAQDQRAVQDGQAQRIASELKTLGLLGVWAQSCERSARYREIYVRSGRSFFRLNVPDAPPNRFNREIIDFQRLSANRFQFTARGRASSEENAIITSKYRMENNRLIPEDIRTASGQVAVERGRIAIGRLKGEAVRALVKCRGPRTD